MNTVTPNNKIIHTNKAECRDCYRCVRVCPVKAIKMKDEQAYVEENNCILCGNCIKACPQNAKSYRNDIAKVKELLANENIVAASIAPSFASFFDPAKIASALRALGFSYVAETSNGVDEVSNASIDEFKKKDITQICSSCPAVVNYIEKYDNSLTKNLVEFTSPMLVHSVKIKSKFAVGTKVVFIGPCLAKKAEAEREEYAGYVDAVLTFEELEQWFNEKEIDFNQLAEIDFDETPNTKSGLFPLNGGLFKVTSEKLNLKDEEIISTSGYENIKSALNYVQNNDEKVLLDLLFCEHGCINGPGTFADKNIFERQNNLLKYARRINNKSADKNFLTQKIAVNFRPKSINSVGEISEEDILKVLAKIGKTNSEDELNCGACGYNTCREKAIAVINGMAELDMCIPHMRKLAEQRTDKIMETTPNGIVILDNQLNIIHINKSFAKIFNCNKSILGKKISHIIDPEGFIKIESEKLDKLEETVEHKKHKKVCHQIFYKLPKENQFVGIFVDITKNVTDKRKLQNLKAHTIMQAQELLDHQIEMSQKMAKLLGESTAQSELLVDNIIKITDDEQNDKENHQSSRKDWRWNISTLK
ncbi:MAG: 4Fe-4S binding protein [Melioribacteraceae bacterium]|nr:4Fe-4S binding protein [Melioribacteraceae bacterium]